MDYELLEREYRSVRRPVYEAFTQSLSSLLEHLLDSQSIPLAHMECRVKTPSSLIEKIREKGYQNPWTDVRDFAGLRLVTYYDDDAMRAVSFLKSEFEWDPKHSLDKQTELGVDAFGYRSLHLIVRLKEPRISLPEWSCFADLWAEIQVRSVLQHAWAAISRKLDYRTTYQAPKPLRRQLFRLSGLLELADEQFMTVRNEVEEIKNAYREDVRSGELDSALDIDSLSEYLTSQVSLSYWEKLGVEVGMRQPSTREKVTRRAVARLLSVLAGIGIETIAQFDSLLEEAKPLARETLLRFERELEAHDRPFTAVCVDVLTIMLYVLYAGRMGDNLEGRGQSTHRPEVKELLHRLAFGSDP